MTSRPIDPANETAAAATVVRPVLFVEMLFDSAPVRLHSALGPYQLNGNTYKGAGGMGSIEAFEESIDSSGYSLQMQISGLDAETVAASLTEDYYGRECRIHLGFFDANNTEVATPDEWFFGFIDAMDGSMGESNVIEVTCEHEAAIGERDSRLRFNDADQQAEFPGDLGFEYTSDAAKATFQWGGSAVRNTTNVGAERYFPGSNRSRRLR